ncbi:MAG: 1-deoxy-D-xylulose-5-phosphate synthase, partial [Tenericutes bacterium]|nr:1-deoxy-D-xylulose-5-phosphate synthase [Mycoplasmatota bacterium]
SKHKLPINLYNARFIKPFDTVTVDKIFASGLPTFVLEDVVKISGLGSSLLEYAIDKEYTVKNFHILGLPDEFIEQGTVQELYKKYSLDTLSVIERIQK